MKQLKGGSLIYSLMIFVIIGSLLGMIIFLNALQGSYSHQTLGPIWAKHNMESGVMSLLEAGFQENKTLQNQLFNDQSDSCLLKTERWGMYGLVHATGTHKNSVFSSSCLIGQLISDEKRYALQTKNQQSTISLAGQVSIQGKVFVPNSAFRAVSLPGISYQADLRQATVKPSSTFLNRPYWQNWEAIKQQLQELRTWQRNSSAYVLEHMIHQQAWRESPKVIQAASSLTIGDCALEGKILILADEIIVKANSQLKHCILMGRRIKIEDGFRGNLQAYALETIEIGTSVNLTYPSLLALLPDTPDPISFQLGQYTTIEGEVFISRNPFRTLPNRYDNCTISENSSLWGSVYCSQSLDFRGNMNGRLVTNDFIFHTPSRIYNHTLVNATFHENTLSKSFVGGMAYMKEPYQIVEWLEE
ncbi:MAG: hypothetical protein AAFY71_24435 [Bacteroidota bacterium]